MTFLKQIISASLSYCQRNTHDDCRGLDSLECYLHWKEQNLFKYNKYWLINPIFFYLALIVSTVLPRRRTATDGETALWPTKVWMRFFLCGWNTQQLNNSDVFRGLTMQWRYWLWERFNAFTRSGGATIDCAHVCVCRRMRGPLCSQGCRHRALAKRKHVEQQWGEDGV